MITRINNTTSPTKTVYFTPTVAAKIPKLVEVLPGEVGAYGSVHQLNDDTYLITELFVYPQETSAATVTTDDANYAAWLNTLDDTTINSLNFQMHSHVNMGVSPSTTDIETNLRLTHSSKKPFYIFAIVNKKGEMDIRVYDKETDSVYSKEHVKTGIYHLGAPLDDWVKESMKMIKTKTYTYTPTSTYTAHHAQQTTSPKPMAPATNGDFQKDMTEEAEFWKKHFKEYYDDLGFPYDLEGVGIYGYK